MFLLHPYFVLVWCQHSTNGRNLHKTRHQVCRVNCDKKRFSFTDAKEDCSPPWVLVQSNGRRKEKEQESSSLNVRFAAEGGKSCEEMMQSPVWKCLREVWMYKQALTSPGAQRPPGCLWIQPLCRKQCFKLKPKKYLGILQYWSCTDAATER